MGWRIASEIIFWRSVAKLYNLQNTAHMQIVTKRLFIFFEEYT
jgi:hypothetical protein